MLLVVLREHADSAASESMAIEPWKDRIVIIVASRILFSISPLIRP